MRKSFNVAIIGAGVAGLACARTLMQAGHDVTVIDQEDQVGGRLTVFQSMYGNFDSGQQFFTLSDARLANVLDLAPGSYEQWRVRAVQVLDGHGGASQIECKKHDTRYIIKPTMQNLAEEWSKPLQAAGKLMLGTQAVALEHDKIYPHKWQVQLNGSQGVQQVLANFDVVIMASACTNARALLNGVREHQYLMTSIEGVETRPVWTMLIVFAQISHADRQSFGPHWDAAYSAHHRVAWLARENSKPGRTGNERWVVQANPNWSQEHLRDSPERVRAKLLKSFSEITGIRATPTSVEAQCARHAYTEKPLGKSFVWDASSNIGICGEWCLGNGIEDAFISGLELALYIA